MSKVDSIAFAAAAGWWWWTMGAHAYEWKVDGDLQGASFAVATSDAEGGGIVSAAGCFRCGLHYID